MTQLTRALHGLGLVALTTALSCSQESTLSAPGPSADRLESFLSESSTLPRRTALLVGVGDYGPSGLHDLPGCRNDVELMRALLSDRFGFPETEIFVLLDDQATHKNIVQAFDEVLLKRSGPETQAIFYMAGHGSRVHDLSGEKTAEVDSMDSTFLAYDSRMGGLRGEHDISDDELRCLMEALTRKTEHVLAITDSCHSGDLMRGGSERSVPNGEASVDFDWVRDFFPEEATLTEDGPGERLEDSRYVHLAATRRDQLAREVQVEIGGQVRTHGALTYYLVRALEQAQRDTTWRQVAASVSAIVQKEAHQTISVAGNLDRGVFNGKFTPAFGYEARMLGSEDSLLVYAGFLLGLRAGSQLEVWNNAGDHLIGEVKVIDIRPDCARAQWTTEDHPTAAGVAYRVREVRRGFGQPALRIHAQDNELISQLKGAPLAEFIEEIALADYVLTKDVDSQLILREVGGVLVSRDGNSLETILAKEVTFLGLCELASERGELPIEMTFRTPTLAELEDLRREQLTVKPVRVLEVPSSKSARVEGQAIGASAYQVGIFDLRNTGEVDLFVCVLSLEESRARTLLKLSGSEKQIVVAAGATASVPVGLVVREDFPKDRPMLDRYIALAFDHKLRDTQWLEATGALRSGSAPLPGILQSAFNPSNTRGDTPEKLSPKGWGVDYVDLLVVHPLGE
ncbi:MAG: hypothetical protein ACI9F9_001866 [Candidatus Paceibacteria bacterium]|jgi:hypothetical protein